MSAQKTNSLVFVAVLVAAIVVIFALANRPTTNTETEGDGVAEGTPGDTNPMPPVETDDGASQTDLAPPADDPSVDDPAQPPVEQASATPTTLIQAAEAGDPALLTQMLDNGEDVDQTDASGRTALMQAASEGHVEAVFILLNAGADASVRDTSRRAARDYAMARADEPGQTIARVLDDALGVTPIQDASDK